MRLVRPLAIGNANIPRKIKEELNRRKTKKTHIKINYQLGINIIYGIKITSS